MRADLLRCPVCGGGLEPDVQGHCLRCESGHSFDIARQGYVSLVRGTKSRPLGDTAAMVQARKSFLDSGHFAPIAAELVRQVRQCVDRQRPAGGDGVALEHDQSDGVVMADLGGGTGWYSAQVLDELPELEGVLLDASAAAAKIAARAHPRLTVATADLWQPIPVSSSSCDVVMIVFAPRNPLEIARILRPGGICLVVAPRPDHLQELRQVVPLLAIDPAKESRLEEQFSGFAARTTCLTYTRLFTRSQASDAIAMGPNAFHLTPEDISRLTSDFVPQHVTISVTVHRFTKR